MELDGSSSLDLRGSICDARSAIGMVNFILGSRAQECDAIRREIKIRGRKDSLEDVAINRV